MAKTAKFEDVVKRHSDFADERLSGGDTGWLVSDAPNKRYPDVVLSALLALAKPGDVGAPLQGRLTKIMVKVGDVVKKNQPLFVIEAMKMESIVTAQQPGTVKQVLLTESTVVEQDDWVVEIG